MSSLLSVSVMWHTCLKHCIICGQVACVCVGVHTSSVRILSMTLWQRPVSTLFQTQPALWCGARVSTGCWELSTHSAHIIAGGYEAHGAGFLTLTLREWAECLFITSRVLGVKIMCAPCSTPGVDSYVSKIHMSKCYNYCLASPDIEHIDGHVSSYIISNRGELIVTTS